MTLNEMCMVAARESDRYDEFELTGDMYEDDALHYFNVFRDAINEAYFEVARTRFEPDIYVEVQVDEDGKIDLLELSPQVYSVRNVLNENRTSAVAFEFDTKFKLDVSGAAAGDTVVLYYHYMPNRLVELDDEPIFSEALVDPMVYICLAVARMWQSEKKLTLYESWLAEYYNRLRGVKSNMKGGNLKRVPRNRFR